MTDVVMVFQLFYYNKRKNIKPLDDQLKFFFEGATYLVIFMAIIGMCAIYGVV